MLYPGGISANYLYFPNAQDKRLQQIKHVTSKNALISQFDYTYDLEGQIQTWTKNYAGLAAPQRFDLGYDNADQLTTAPLKNANTSALIKQYTYGYDPASRHRHHHVHPQQRERNREPERRRESDPELRSEWQHHLRRRSPNL